MISAMEILERLFKARDYLKNNLPEIPDMAIIAGSGLGGFTKNVKCIKEIGYQEIPYFPVSTVVGHKGSLIFADSDDKKVIIFNGRKHIYEGAEMWEVIFAVRVMALIGVKFLIITNAAGGLNENFKVGDLMLINDHINFMGRNPLIGENVDEFGERFFDMSNAYNKELRKLVKDVAKKENIDLKEGVYIGVTGPSYETDAEIKMMCMLGADAVGMSTVPEVIAAVHCGLKVIGISYISNINIKKEEGRVLTHQEVIDNAKLVEEKFAKLIKGIIKKL